MSLTYRVSTDTGEKRPQLVTADSANAAARRFTGLPCWYHSGRLDHYGEVYQPERGPLVRVELA